MYSTLTIRAKNHVRNPRIFVIAILYIFTIIYVRGYTWWQRGREYFQCFSRNITIKDIYAISGGSLPLEMSTFAHLPVPKPLSIHSAEVAKEWKHWRKTWENYALATELKDKEPQVQVATLLKIIGSDANRVFETFEWIVKNHKTDLNKR